MNHECQAIYDGGPTYTDGTENTQARSTWNPRTARSVTTNAASTLNVEHGVGKLVEGGVADINILRTKSADGWCQMPGDNPVKISFHHSEL